MTNTKNRTFSLTLAADECIDELYEYFKRIGMNRSRASIVSNLIVAYRHQKLGDNHTEDKKLIEVYNQIKKEKGEKGL